MSGDVLSDILRLVPSHARLSGLVVAGYGDAMGPGEDEEREPPIRWGAPMPVYMQVADILRRRILTGRLAPDDRLP